MRRAPNEDEPITLRVYGHEHGIILAWPGPSKCGDEGDGVSFAWPRDGAWLVPFKDLETLYLAAKKARKVP